MDILPAARTTTGELGPDVLTSSLYNMRRSDIVISHASQPCRDIFPGFHVNTMLFCFIVRGSLMFTKASYDTHAVLYAHRQYRTAVSSRS